MQGQGQGLRSPLPSPMAEPPPPPPPPPESEPAPGTGPGDAPQSPFSDPFAALVRQLPDARAREQLRALFVHLQAALDLRGRELDERDRDVRALQVRPPLSPLAASSSVEALPSLASGSGGTIGYPPAWPLPPLPPPPPLCFSCIHPVLLFFPLQRTLCRNALSLSSSSSCSVSHPPPPKGRGRARRAEDGSCAARGHRRPASLPAGGCGFAGAPAAGRNRGGRDSRARSRGAGLPERGRSMGSGWPAVRLPAASLALPPRAPHPRRSVSFSPPPLFSRSSPSFVGPRRLP